MSSWLVGHLVGVAKCHRRCQPGYPPACQPACLPACLHARLPALLLACLPCWCGIQTKQALVSGFGLLPCAFSSPVSLSPSPPALAQFPSPAIDCLCKSISENARNWNRHSVSVAHAFGCGAAGRIEGVSCVVTMHCSVFGVKGNGGGTAKAYIAVHCTWLDHKLN